MSLRRSDDGSRAIAIRYDGEGRGVDRDRGVFSPKDGLGPFRLKAFEEMSRLHVFLDKGVIEVYANTRACYSRLIHIRAQDLQVSAFSKSGTVTLKSLDALEMNPIW